MFYMQCDSFQPFYSRWAVRVGLKHLVEIVKIGVALCQCPLKHRISSVFVGEISSVSMINGNVVTKMSAPLFFILYVKGCSAVTAGTQTQTAYNPTTSFISLTLWRSSQVQRH